MERDRVSRPISVTAVHYVRVSPVTMSLARASYGQARGMVQARSAFPEIETVNASFVDTEFFPVLKQQTDLQI